MKYLKTTPVILKSFLSEKVLNGTLTSTQIKVGVFLVIGVFLVLISIYMFGGDKALFKSYTRLHAHFEQVQGLAEGSVVSLSGIVIGNVEKIEFVHEKNVLDVTLQIEPKYLSRISTDSKVEVRTQGALGDKYVFIIAGNPESPKVKAGDVLEVAQSADILGILSQRGNDTARFFDILNELYKLTHTLNKEQRIDQILQNMAAASADLKSGSREARKILEDQQLVETLKRIDKIVARIDRGEGTLGALINDPSIHQRLKALLGASDKKSHLKSVIQMATEAPAQGQP